MRNGWTSLENPSTANCVCGKSETAFVSQYQKWCSKAWYKFSAEKALSPLYAYAALRVCTLPIADVVSGSIARYNETISVIQHEMLPLASQLPEHLIVMRMFGIDSVLAP